MAACTCSVDLSNTGAPNCQPLPDVIVRLILTPIKDSSGTLNRIDLTSLPTNSAIIDLINNADDKARLYPLPTMENVTNERGDNITEEFPSGTVKFIRNGVKTFTGEMINSGAIYAGQLDSYRCATMGAYMVDAQGNLLGDISVDGYLAPLAIDNGSWAVKSIDATDTTTPKVSLTFQWLKTLQDGDVGFIAAGDFASDVDWLDYNGLLDLDGTVIGTPTTTTFAMKVSTIFGSAASPQVVDGLTASDFELEETSPTPGAIVITSVTESPAGQYNFVIPAATSGDLLSLSIASATKGYDDTNLAATVITIP